jgi:phytoene desaturase
MSRLVAPEHLRTYTPERLRRMRYSCSTFMLYLGLDRTFPDLAHHSVILSEGYRENIAEIEGGTIPDVPSLYVQNAGATDPTMAPPG